MVPRWDEMDGEWGHSDSERRSSRYSADLHVPTVVRWGGRVDG